LRPRFNCLFQQPCVSCGRRSWSLLGLPLGKPPNTLVCRQTGTLSGCYHPITIPALQGRRVVHAGLAGVTLAAKHGVMAHLFAQLVEHGTGGAGYRPGWEVTGLELQLCQAILYRAFETDTSACETPGRRWTLAWTAVFEPQGAGRTLAFHNIVDQLLTDTDQLARNSLNWKDLDSLILVLDPAQLGLKIDPHLRQPVEIWSRLVRVIEEYCSAPAGQCLPCKVAVVLAVPERGHSLAFLPAELKQGLTALEVERIVRENDPALAALLRRTVAGRKLRFFGGIIPQTFDLTQTRWLEAALRWIAG